jgi:uncharacterized membrane protein
MPWLFLAYPLLAHLATVLHSQGLAGLALLALIAVPLLPALRHGKPWAWLLLSGSAAALFFCARSGWAAYVTYLPPVLVPLSVLAVFARSLRSGQVPIVTRLATRIRSEVLSPELQIYTRRVTQCWVFLLCGVACSSALLAVFASPRLWSLMTNVVMYFLIGSAFLIEYLYRRWRFRHLRHESFATLVAELVKNRGR